MPYTPDTFPVRKVPYLHCSSELYRSSVSFFVLAPYDSQNCFGSRIDMPLPYSAASSKYEQAKCLIATQNKKAINKTLSHVVCGKGFKSLDIKQNLVRRLVRPCENEERINTSNDGGIGCAERYVGWMRWW